MNTFCLLLLVMILSSISTKLVHYHKLPRIYLPLGTKIVGEQLIGCKFDLDEENSNYVSKVMRMKEHDQLRVFDELHGEFLVEVASSGNSNTRKRRSDDQVQVIISKLLREKHPVKTFKSILYFAPIKKEKIKLLLEKATELGIDEFQPVLTQNTNSPIDLKSTNIRSTCEKIIIQSCEQSERLSIPKLHDVITWKELLQRCQLRQINKLFVCRERALNALSDDHSQVLPILDAFTRDLSNPARIPPHSNEQSLRIGFLIGPEGGFTSEEFQALESIQQEQHNHSTDNTHTIRFVSLGENVLRAETAAIASISAFNLWMLSNSQ